MDSQSSVPSSSSSPKRVWKYDVATCCSDMETTSFYRMLSNALGKEGFRMIGSGWVNPLEKIEESQIYIVVFSKSYVYSPSCLNTLAVMFECMKVPGHKFLPIFFNIDPSKVKTWLAPFQTLLERPDLVIQNTEDQRRVIGKIALEAKRTLVEEKETVLASPLEIWPWSCDVFVLNFITEENCSFVEELRNALYRCGLVMASRDSIARAPLNNYKLRVFIVSKNYEAQTPYLQELNSWRGQFLSIFLEVDPFQVHSGFHKLLEQKLGPCSLPIRDLVIQDKYDLLLYLFYAYI
ncbi:uncharacterized protein LOC129322557 [Prosopis cineraria]|uniref:uncharacterized protein LOC129322557 n=1 Tax=Prosopis cineraria TaxID=364024 RepID=UPI00240F7420|nr:uncharacterized protein LOC129322557 [Prosopis cineraria]